jgi:hypothetical protein
MINTTGGDSRSSPPGHGVLDTGTTTTVLAGEHHRYFMQYETAPDSHVMATAARGGTLEIAGGGTAGMFAGVMHSHDLRHSVVSVSQLTIHGFRVIFSDDTAEVIHPDGQRIESVKQPGCAIWWVPLDQIFETPTPDLQDFIGVLGERQPDVDELELLHRRTGHTSYNALRQCGVSWSRVWSCPVVTSVARPSRSTRASATSAGGPRSPDAPSPGDQTA